MGHLEKLPQELFHLITLSLDVYDLYHLLVLFPSRGLYSQLRRASSNQARLVALLYAIHLGSLDLIQQIPNISQLIRRFDDYARYEEHSDENAFFAGHDSMAQKFATINFRGYINPLIIAINARSTGTDDSIIQFLLQKGAQLDVPDKFHRRAPLYIATDNKDLHVARLLLKYQAPPNLTLGSHWRVPLDAAVERNHVGDFEGIEVEVQFTESTINENDKKPETKNFDH
ncbi:hypothetical protein N7523_005750 [Penicillium sp. IBT 18751x]|nr:hypothetical protein N7523_005658 [Penicillium sp. IBT 18751x]KAJ6117999.1 hypothetical protein N7523_005750 [Penicillium sp. IBT 18751x]